MKYIATAKDDYGNDLYSPCECMIAENQARSFNSSQITFEFKQKNFDTFDLADIHPSVRMAFHTCRGYANQFQKVKDGDYNGMCILGNVGCGKTHLLMAICNHLMTNQYLYNGVLKFPRLLYFPWVEGFNGLKNDLSSLEEHINKMQKADVLYIDDMWKGRKEATDFQIEQIFAVINYRYIERLPTLISSEKDIDAMCRIDEAIGSRINEMCRNFRIILKGGKELNYRMKEEIGS